VPVVTDATGAGHGAVHDTEALLLRVQDLVEGGRNMPMSASVLVNRDEVLTLLEDAIANLPEELRQARWLLKEREEFLAHARREADDIVEAGRVQAERMVERTEVVREARRRAQGLVDDAEAAARALRHEAEDYVDQRLASFEVVLERTMQAVQKGRQRLQVVVELPAEDTDAEHAESTFFDQDQS
jgi:F0F1-type ATP synthase membrane subunit b/b'